MAGEFTHVDCGGTYDLVPHAKCSECGQECLCTCVGREGPCNLCEASIPTDEVPTPKSELDQFREVFKNGLMF